MIRYVKGLPPPRLTTLTATPMMNWDGLGAPDRDPIRESLVRDQGALCAYCQRRITTAPNPDSGLSQMKIEHWIPRSHPEARHLAWSHLLGVCQGASLELADRRADRITTHCDSSRGNHKLFLHPVEGQGPDPTEHLRYKKNGVVEPSHADTRVADDIRVLNLNARQLVRGREAVFDAAWKRLERSKFAVGELRRMEQAHRIVAGAHVPEHAAFVRFHVIKKLRSLGHSP